MGRLVIGYLNDILLKIDYVGVFWLYDIIKQLF